ncbi:MAG: nucleotidyltransferase domain-containing protein [Candidatus Bathyarchaeia archaeon]
MEILKERERLREKVLDDCKKWAVSLPFKASAILIGSYARGDFNLWSDVDIVLISDLTGTPLEKLKRIDYPPGFEVIPLTLAEFLTLLRRGNPMATEAVEKGIILRDDFNIAKFYRKIKEGEVKRET